MTRNNTDFTARRDDSVRCQTVATETIYRSTLFRARAAPKNSRSSLLPSLLPRD